MIRIAKNWIKENIVLSAILAICTGYAVFYLVSVIRWVPYPNQIDYGEGLIMYINNMWATGTWKWDMSIPPYLPLIYGITTPLLFVPLIKLFGAGLWVGRTVMVISTLITCWLLYLVAKRITGKKTYGIIAGLLPFTHPVIRDWSLMARVDMLAVMLSFVGFYIVLRCKGSKWIYLSVIPFSMALQTKISIAVGIGATLIYLSIYKRNILCKYICLLVFVIATPFTILGIITQGQYFDHIMLYNATVSAFWNLATMVTNISIVLLPMIAISIAALALAVKMFRKKHRTELKMLVTLFFVIALGTNFFFALRPGGFVNYYLEFIFGACLCTAIVLPSIIEKAEIEFKASGKVFASGLLIMLLIANFSAISYKHAFPFPNEKYTEEVKVATEIIKDTDKPIVTENFGLVTNAGKDIVCEHFISTNAAALGTWDDTNYVNNFRTQYYDYIILRVPTYKRINGDWHFKKEIIDLIDENYTLIYEPIENFYWYGICIYKSNNMLTDKDIQEAVVREREGGESLFDFTSKLPNTDVPGAERQDNFWLKVSRFFSGIFQ